MRLPSATILRAALAGAQISAPVLKWQRGGCTGGGCQTGWYASPAVADLEPDGSPYVVWGAYDVVALNGATGALKWWVPNGQRVRRAIKRPLPKNLRKQRVCA